MRLCRLCAFDRNDDEAVRCRQCGAEMAPLEDESEAETQDSAWFHYLQLPKFGAVELIPGRAFRVGREARNELVLPKASQDLVASYFWTDGYDEATLSEAGAAEEIKVDGIRLKGTRVLKGGEEVQIGVIRMSYLKRATPLEGAIDAGKLKRKGVNPGQAVATPKPGAMRGALDPSQRQLSPPPPRSADSPGVATERRRAVGATPAMVARALEQTRAVGTLRVKSPLGRGWVSVMGGKPRHAAFGHLTGAAALKAIMGLQRASCQMASGTPKGAGMGPVIEVTFSQVLAQLEGGAPRPRPAPPARGAQPLRPRPGPGRPLPGRGAPPRRPSR